MIFGIVMKHVREAGFLGKRAGIHSNPFPDPTLPQQLLCSADDYFYIT